MPEYEDIPQEMERSAATSQQAGRFVWPPRKPVEVVIPQEYRDPPVSQPQPKPTPRNSQSTPAAEPSRSWLSQIEHTWLDTIAPPLRERMAIECWTPDKPDAYCHRCSSTIALLGDASADRSIGLLPDAFSASPGRAMLQPCPDCRNARPPWDRIIRLGEYQQPLSRWVHEVKFTRWRKLGRDLGRVLGQQAVAEIERIRAESPDAIPDSPPLVVPVPTTLWRLLVRGIDHTKAIALGVADEVGGRVVQPLAREHRPSQLHVAPSRRTANLAGAIEPKPAWRRPDLSGRLVIVVDDVTTTGATMRAACRAVGMCGVKGARPLVLAAVLAKTPPDAHDLPVT